MTLRIFAAALLSMFLTSTPSRAADAANALTPEQQRAGWVLLFDGRSPAGWESGGKPLPAANIHDGSINPHKAGAYVSYYDKPFDNFVLALDFKVTDRHLLKLRDLCHRMNDLVLDSGGRFYFAKDSTLRPDDVRCYLGEATLARFRARKAELDPGQRKRLATTIGRLAEELTSRASS